MNAQTVDKLLTLAFHPTTAEPEAIAAFRHARRLGAGPDQSLVSPGSGRDRLITAIGPVATRFWATVVNDLNQAAWDAGARLRLHMTDYRVSQRRYRLGAAAGFQIEADGPPEALRRVDTAVNALVSWLNGRSGAC
ncbi:MAG: hypothetical protein ACTS3R_08705 [Inquilinaceae bacterium]